MFNRMKNSFIFLELIIEKESQKPYCYPTAPRQQMQCPSVSPRAGERALACPAWAPASMACPPQEGLGQLISKVAPDSHSEML